MAARNKKYVFKSCVIIIVCNVVFTALIGMLSYIFDFDGLTESIKHLILGSLSLAGTIYIRRWARVINNEKTRDSIYCSFGGSLFFASLILSGATHKLQHPMVKSLSISNAIQSDEEYFYIDNIEIDTTKQGISTTAKSHESRHGTKIEYLALVTYPIKGSKNGFFGYTLSSGNLRTNTEDKRFEFLSTLNKKIKNYEIPHGAGYYRKVMPNDEDYENYQDACSKIGIQSVDPPVIFCQMNEPTMSDIYEEIRISLIVLAISIIVITLVFTFAKTKKSHKSINKEIEKERNEYLAYFSNRDNWYLISLVLVLIGYFLIMIFGGYNGVFGGVQIEETIKWGALSKYLVVDQCECWRLITSSIMHIGIGHLICNLIGLILFTESNPWVSRSGMLWIVFFITSFAASIAVMILQPQEVLLGASGGIMGLYGFRIGMGIDMVTDTNEKQKNRKNHRKNNILGILINIMGIEGMCIILPTIFISFMPGVSMIAHITGLLSGIAMWYVLKKIQGEGGEEDM